MWIFVNLIRRLVKIWKSTKEWISIKNWIIRKFIFIKISIALKWYEDTNKWINKIIKLILYECNYLISLLKKKTNDLKKNYKLSLRKKINLW